MSMVETKRVTAQEPLHAGDKICIRRFDDEMKVVRHQTIGMQLEASFLTSLGQRFQKILAIDIGRENVVPPITTAHDVINRSRLFHAYFSWHRAILPERN